MPICYLDFECFFSKEVTLKKMSIDEYVKHPKFKIHGVTIAVDDGPAKWYKGRESVAALKKYARGTVVAHNAYFDLFILNYWYKIQPKFIYDTMCMSRALYGPDRSASLKSLGEHLEIGVKRSELLLDLMGVEQLEGDQEVTFVRDYAIPDVTIMRDAFNRMFSQFPHSEAELVDVFIRMYTEPALLLDRELLEGHLDTLTDEKREKVLKCQWILQHDFEGDTYEAIRSILASNPQFADLLEKQGLKVPMKKSLTAKNEDGSPKDTYAFSKKDVGFTKLLEHKQERIRELAEARLAVKSTLEETRTKTFIKKSVELFPVQLMYYGAHTGRASGGSGSKVKGGTNLQNLTRNSPIRRAILAPDGYVVAAADSSQIEARGLAWIAGQDDLVNDFALDLDPYSTFATELYEYPVSKKNPETKVERYVGKTCILGLGYGMGGPKLQWTLETGQIPVKYTEERCGEIVRFYRDKYSRIPVFWRVMQGAIEHIHRGRYKDYGCFSVDALGIRLPNGLYIRYNGLRRNERGDYEYYGKTMGKPGWVKLYGGKATENLIQALARIVVMDQLVEISKRYKVVLTVHDEVVALIPEKEAETGMEWMLEIMHQAPSWANGWPVAAEGGYGRSYGDVK